MDPAHDEQHANHVDAWIERTLVGLPVEAQLAGFTAAIDALQKRTTLTLSDVTLYAILDRALYRSQQRFPLLKHLSISESGIVYDKALPELTKYPSTDVVAAFRNLIIEILSILGNLTAGILIPPLYEALSQVKIARTNE